MYRGYDRLIELTKLVELFTSGDVFNKELFKAALETKNAKKLFDSLYLKDLNCSGYWSLWDFSDRFARFAKALCDAGYCKKIDRVTYIRL